MRLLPKSLTGRLLVTAILALVLALVLAFLVIGFWLDGFVKWSMDGQLDAQIALVRRAVRPDGSVDRSLVTDIPPFDHPGAGWAWELFAPGLVLKSASLGQSSLSLPANWSQPKPIGFWQATFTTPFAPSLEDRPLDIKGPHGRTTHYRVYNLATPRGLVSIVAAVPPIVVETTVQRALRPLLAILLALGVLLAAALIIQLRIGLNPLTRLRFLIGEVRQGRLRSIAVDEPTEILPLIDALNLFIDTNAKALAGARGHAANLAHGLKTPLATLRLDLDNPAIDPDGRLLAQVARMESQIRHHLGRARASELGAMTSTHIALRACLDDLIIAMTRINADRAIHATIDVPFDAAVLCDSQDLLELFGNLLENAWRWAHSTIHIAARPEGRFIRVTIGDDGPGMSTSQIDKVLLEGRRLDEQETGQGFGLSISGELAELHGGSLALARSELGGLEVIVCLVRA